MMMTGGALEVSSLHETQGGVRQMVVTRTEQSRGEERCYGWYG